MLFRLNSSTTLFSFFLPGLLWPTFTLPFSLSVLKFSIHTPVLNGDQLVSSATASGQNNAFNFLSTGVGQVIFEVFLKVSYLTFCYDLKVLTIPQAIYCPPLCHDGMFPW